MFWLKLSQLTQPEGFLSSQASKGFRMLLPLLDAVQSVSLFCPL